ncbi:uncharacterized protein B0H18DRAFT_1121705 [Fomitopsis serialis]|uniref:uncharacterized protein n=1 Tax=Fomitopsis serialis TaxID=139415 RepID=UPI0020076F4F|nr:uncharacterized protein B0H18DRAFT_1121705 [Neoantrodia serialis]KAH9920743.1 hypothetical protein B0H18DRAFT_1121705 [Neoantrodia serialis]
MEEMIKEGGLDEALLNEVYLSWIEVEATHFQIYKRVRHVFEESVRVIQFRARRVSLEQVFRELMSGDELIRIAKEVGAYASRITGESTARGMCLAVRRKLMCPVVLSAGRGGCTVSLVAEDKVDTFIEKLVATYLEGEALKQVIFATKPSSGACVSKLE